MQRKKIMDLRKIGIKICPLCMHLQDEFYGRRKLLLLLYTGWLMKADRSAARWLIWNNILLLAAIHQKITSTIQLHQKNNNNYAKISRISQKHLCRPCARMEP